MAGKTASGKERPQSAPRGKAAASKTPAPTRAKSPKKAPAPKASPSKKTTAKKTTAKKTTAKKPTTKLTPKTTTAKSASASKTSKRPSAKSDQAKVVQADLKRLEARMKRADTLNRNSVKSLETIVNVLDARVSSGDQARKVQLNKQVHTLSARLDDQLAKTRGLIRQELHAAMVDGGLENIGAAVTQASARMDAAELAQADAITRINRHLADLARAVDARIEAERAERQRDIASIEQRLAEARSELETQVETRVGHVEQESVEALGLVGEKIEALHGQLDERRAQDTDVVTEKVNELALQTQAEFEAYQTRIDARLRDMERQSRDVEARLTDGLANVKGHEFDNGSAIEAATRDMQIGLEQQIAYLQTRIEALERRPIADIETSVSAMASAPAPATSPASNNVVPMAPANFAPAQTSGQLGAMPNPYAAAAAPQADLGDIAPASSAAPVQNREPHEPVEFDPTAYAESRAAAAPAPTQVPPAISTPQTPPPAAFAPVPTAPPAPIISKPVQTPPPGVVPTATAKDMASASPIPPSIPPIPGMSASALSTGQGDLKAPLPDAPYANPAYAEDDSPKAVRITEDGKKPSLLSRLPITGPQLRIAALATGVAVVGVFAAKSVLGTERAPDPTAGRPVQTAPQSVQSAGETAPSAVTQPGVQILDPAQETAAPIGAYAETAPITIPAAGVSTLEAAVEAGDPIAQFQMGLAKLESGDKAEGARLIRLSADQDQPTALYRLAKLYESGEGVPQNVDMARELTERAARGGNRLAMHDLALYHTDGRGGLASNMVTARSWFEQAAQRGVVDSQFNLAVLSENPGAGLKPNPDQALFWYMIAAAQGDQFAMQRRDALTASLDPDQVARIRERAEAFEPRPIDQAANGIFRDLPWMQAAKKTAAREDVRTVQTLLSQLGFQVGSADGLMGSKTRTAIMSFEKANGLPETGRVNADLIARLELAAGA